MAALRLLFAAIAVTALALGYAGMTSYLRHRSGLGHGSPDVLYYVLQLFVLDSAPLDSGGPYPVALEIARFAAPSVTVYAIVDAFCVLFSERLRRFRMRMTRDHCLICGAGPAAGVLAEKLAANGERVITIGPQGDRGVGRRHFHITGDPTHGRLLRAAGVHRAKALYAFSPESAANARIALTAQQLLPRSQHELLNAYMYVPDPDLCQGLRARRLGLGEAQNFRLDFFNPAQIAARVLLEDHPLGQDDRHVLIVGLTSFGREVAVEMARHWRMLEPLSEARPTMTLVDREASRVLDGLIRRYTFLRLWDLVALDCSPEDFDPRRLPGSGGRPDRTVFCHGDPDRALHTALTAVHLWQGAPGSIVVAVDQNVTYGNAFTPRPEGTLLDGLSGRLIVHSILDSACDPLRIGDDLVEQLARAIHEQYVLNRMSRGETVADNPSLVPWRELPETLRSANRGQALDIGNKIASMDATLAPHEDPDLSFSFTGEEIERLSRLEHQRWVRERETAGWRFGRVRDNDRRLHPQLIDWSHLDEEAREKDRDAVRAMPRILAAAGFQIVRLTPPAPPGGGRGNAGG